MKYKNVVIRKRTYNGYTIKPLSLEGVGYFCEILQNGMLEEETVIHGKLADAIHEAEAIADELALEEEVKTDSFIW